MAEMTILKRSIATDLDKKFISFFQILTVLYHGISNGHTKYEFQILS
jgi:hypothetical protein